MAPQGEGAAPVVASIQGSVSVKLHPLVIMNISEHWTRIKVQNAVGNQSKDYMAVGALIGACS